jgi:hypothetical protein
VSLGNPKERKRNQTISARQERVATCLATGQPVARAARECRVGECTIWAWLKQPPFRERVSELRRELTDRAIGRLADMMAGAAADTLLKLLEAKSDSVRLDSVKAVYDLFVNVTNAAELKARIEQLEANQPRGPR